MPPWFFITSMALFGLLFGSFANVVIWRFPRGESVVAPGSHCPSCETAIAWYDNIPVFSWLALRARCRSCGTRIARRYPLVEAASGALFAAAAARFGMSAQTAVAAMCFWLLLVLSAIDLDHMRLPNPLVVALAGLGLCGAVVAQATGVAISPLIGVATAGALSEPLLAATAGAVLGVAVSGGVAAVYGAVRGVRGLGMGDVKLLGALGLLLGAYVLMVLFLGSIIGMIFGIASARGRKLSEVRLPFGPSLAGAAVVTALFGPWVWEAYLRLMGLV